MVAALGSEFQHASLVTTVVAGAIPLIVFAVLCSVFAWVIAGSGADYCCCCICGSWISLVDDWVSQLREQVAAGELMRAPSTAGSAR